MTGAMRWPTMSALGQECFAGRLMSWFSLAGWNAESVTAAGTVALAVLTLTLAAATFFLWLATRRLVKGSEENAVRQLRAYVLIEGGFITRIQSANGSFLKAHVQSKNFGQTPAYRFKAWQRIAIFDTGRDPRYETGNGRGASDVGPGATREVSLHLGPIAESDFLGIRKGDKTIHIWGRFDYSDAFDKPRHLNFFLKNGREVKDGGWLVEPAERPHESN